MKLPLLKVTNDFVFQYLFGSEENKDILISLLAAILQITIKSLKLLPREIPRNAEDLKSAVLDITAELDDGTLATPRVGGMTPYPRASGMGLR